MRKNMLFFLIILVNIVFTTPLMAVEVTLRTVQGEYGPGDTILITAELHNTDDTEAQVNLAGVLSGRSGKVYGMSCQLSAALKPREFKIFTLYEIDVEDAFPPDEYEVAIRLLADGMVEEEMEISFEVKGTLQELAVEVSLRRSREAESETRVFIRGENICADIESSEQAISAVGALVFPDGSEKRLKLPFTLKAEASGSYKLTVTASKSGFTQETRMVYFAVIETKPEIPHARGE